MTNVLPFLAVTMGLMSSVHCIGMCGPIALALPTQNGSSSQRFSGLLIYNLGRASSYAALGALLGIFGSAISVFGYLKYLSILIGCVMLAYVFWPSVLNRFFHPPKIWIQLVGKLRKAMGVMLKSPRKSARFSLGILNGLIPCGLIYIALLSSAATGTVPGGALFMFLFGTGTIPAMMAIGIFKDRITPAIRKRFSRATPFVIAVAALIMVGRGGLLEYPSNKNPNSKEITICHGKNTLKNTP